MGPSTMKKIIGLGEVLYDVLPQGAKLGGAPANFAYHASQFGYEAVAVSAVGNDALGLHTRCGMGSYPLHTGDGRGCKERMRRMLRVSGAAQRGVARNDHEIPRCHSEGLPEDLRY